MTPTQKDKFMTLDDNDDGPCLACNDTGIPAPGTPPNPAGGCPCGMLPNTGFVNCQAITTGYGIRIKDFET